jgi:hypothetical protein
LYVILGKGCAIVELQRFLTVRISERKNQTGNFTSCEENSSLGSNERLLPDSNNALTWHIADACVS